MLQTQNQKQYAIYYHTATEVKKFNTKTPITDYAQAEALRKQVALLKGTKDVYITPFTAVITVAPEMVEIAE